MYMEQVPLSRQLELVFRALKEELATLAAGTIIVQIRNNLIGKFGVKQVPARDMTFMKAPEHGLSDQHVQMLRQIGASLLQHKRWTHGEMQLEFSLDNEELQANAYCESNYNMNNLLVRQDGAGRA